MSSVVATMLQILIFISIVSAAHATFTGLSVYVYNKKLSITERRWLTASLGSAMLFLPLMLIWTINEGWLHMTKSESISWLLYHLMVLYVLNGYHVSLRRKLGFQSFKQFWTKWKSDARGEQWTRSFYRTFISSPH